MVVKDKPVAIGRRGNFVDISGELSQSGFTGIAEISYRMGEISRARAVFVKGKMVEIKVNKLISKTELTGDEALDELLRVERCVVDIYTINESSLNALELEESFGLGGNSDGQFDEQISSASEVEVHHRLDTVENAIEIGTDSQVEEVELSISRDEILKKYKIKEPSEEEIEAIIRKAVEDELGEFELEVFEEFDGLKKELRALARKYLGKLSKKIEDSIEHATFPEELVELITEIRNSKSLLIFVPKEKLNKLAEEMDALIKARNVEKVNN